MKLEIKNLIVETNEKIVVDNVSLSVGGGEIVVIVGENGSGKTSLLNTIAGHPKYKIKSGEILLDGVNVSNLSVDERARMGIFLSMQILPEIEGVSMANFLHTAYKSLKGSGTEISVMDFYKYLEAKADEFAINKDFLQRELNVGFSGGEKKQAELLQMVALEPKIAILDEIDSGVDAEAIKKVFAGIEVLRKNGTGFLLVTHNQSVMEKLKPNKVLVMEGGKIKD